MTNLTHERVWLKLLLICLLTACAGSPWKEQRDPISAGTAKLILKTQMTTQAEVLEVFGGPNVIAGGADGAETWSYDRMSYESRHAAGGGVGGAGGVIGSVPVGGLFWGHASRSASSSRTVTLFLYWQDGVLENFRYRSASF